MNHPWESSPAGVISFYLPERQALQGADPETLDCDRDWEVFGTGVYVWVLQTYLRLRAAGAPVRLIGTPPPSGVIVTHADYVERLLDGAASAADLTVVSTRSDRRPQVFADFEVVQNASSVEDFQIFIPSWLQPGLMPRRPDRATWVENVAYFGSRRQLHDDFTSVEWIDALRVRGLGWDTRMATWVGNNDQPYVGHRWNDCSTVDVIVALRPRWKWSARTKPAAKLTNAWAAGVPAILNPELCYRELRRSSLDYFEARSAGEALEAIDRLRSDPELYAAMVANGFKRAAVFHPESLTARWAETLWHTVPERTSGQLYRLGAMVRGYRSVVRRARCSLRRSTRAAEIMPPAG
jgi:hypothetical protein